MVEEGEALNISHPTYKFSKVVVKLQRSCYKVFTTIHPHCMLNVCRNVYCISDLIVLGS